MNQMTPIAAGIASLGRGNDKMLVHMTPGEVRGLQSLAMAHGGSLTINPHTGLPEDGILSSLIPMMAGAVLTPIMGPMGAALVVGGLGTVATGSIGKGLMMGLGAYGGAGLGESLSAAGAAEGNALASSELAKASNAATEAGAAASDQITRLANAPIEGAVRPSDFVQNPYTPEGAAYIQSQLDMPLEQIAQSAKEYAADAYQFPGYTPTTQAALNRGPFENAWEGFKGLGTEAGRDRFMNAVGGVKGLAMKGGMAAAPMLMAGLQPKPLETPPKKPYEYYKTSYSQQRNPLWGQPGQPYFIQSYGPGSYTTDPREVTMAKAGGLMALADGGYVPESGSVRIPTVEDENNESRVPDTKIRFAGYAPEKSGSLANLSELQLKLIAARSTDPEKRGAAIRELYVRQGTQQPRSQFISAEKFMAADGGVVPAPQMPISPLFQQTPAANPAALENYLAQLGTQIMATGASPSTPATPTPTPQLPATNQYGYNPATQTFFMNPNYVAPDKPAESDDNDGGSEGSGDAAGGPIKARYAAGGLGSLPEYAAGGRLLDSDDYAAGGDTHNRVSDGVADLIPAVIKGPKPQRAALADGEFVIPARIVSELGNGSTKAGAKRLYAMMERVQQARRKTTRKGEVAVDTKPDKLLPA